MLGLPVLIAEILKLVNLLLEGTPVELRKAQAVAWFWVTWPMVKAILKLSGAPADAMAAIEKAMGELNKADPEKK